MLYESYEKRIIKLVKIKDKIIKYKVPIIIGVGLFFLLLSVFISLKGIVIKDITNLNDKVYGEKLFLESHIFCGKGTYEFSEDGGETWSSEEPVLPGNYHVRVLSRRAFGIRSKGKPHGFHILKKEITLELTDKEVVYGENIGVKADLVPGDRIDDFKAVWEDRNIGISSVAIENSSVVIKNENGVDVSGAYDFDPLKQTISVVKRKIVVSPKNCEKVYDGTNYIKTDGVVSKNSKFDLLEGHIIETECETESVDINAKINQIKNYVIRDAEGKDVTKNYEVETNTGFVVIKKRPVTVYPELCEKIYDGTNITNIRGKAVSGSEFGLIDGHYAEVICESDSSGIAASKNTIKKVSIKDARGEDVSENYSITRETGQIKILKKAITVGLVDKEKVYDGEPLICSETVIKNGELVARQSLLVKTSGKIVNCGTEINTIIDLKIITEEGEDVSENYIVNKESGLLKINKRNITIIAGTLQKVYDKKPLFCKDYNVDNLVKTHKIVGIFTEGSITYVGSVKNKLNFTDNFAIIDESGINQTSNYEISFEDGKLLIVPKAIRVSLIKKTKEYDGEFLTIPGSDDYWIAEGCVVQGDEIVGVYNIYAESTEYDEYNIRYYQSVVLAGKYKTTGRVRVADSATGEDLSFCYNIDCSGELVIEKRVMKFTVDSNEQVYFFSELRCIYNSIMPKGQKIVSGEKAKPINELFEEIKVKDSYGTDVTNCYMFVYVPKTELQAIAGHGFDVSCESSEIIAEFDCCNVLATQAVRSILKRITIH